MHECPDVDVITKDENDLKDDSCSPFSPPFSSEISHQKKRNGFIVPIDEIENPTIDAVLNRVPLVYDSVTKQLLLPKEYDVNTLNRRNGFHRPVTNDAKNLDDDTSINDRLTKNDDNHVKTTHRDSKYLSFINNDSNYDKALLYSDPNDVSSHQKACDSEESLKFDSDNDDVSTKEEVCVNNDDGASNNESNLSSLSFKDFEVTNYDKKFKKIFSLPFHNLLSKVKRKNSVNDITISTTALILENRPSHLPAKDYDEEIKHKLEYEEMVKTARKKEAKDAKLKKKLMHKQLKQEEQVILAIKFWANEILPKWDDMKEHKKTQELWWNGVPSSVRERVWTLAIGNDLNITIELFDICVNRSREKIWTMTTEKDGAESFADSIRLDVSRTFPQLGIFQEKGPYHEILRTVLGAYVVYRPDIGMCFYQKP